VRNGCEINVKRNVNTICGKNERLTRSIPTSKHQKTYEWVVEYWLDLPLICCHTYGEYRVGKPGHWFKVLGSKRPRQAWKPDVRLRSKRKFFFFDVLHKSFHFFGLQSKRGDREIQIVDYDGRSLGDQVDGSCDTELQVSL
jgi:hypothetical protein